MLPNENNLEICLQLFFIMSCAHLIRTIFFHHDPLLIQLQSVIKTSRDFFMESTGELSIETSTILVQYDLLIEQSLYHASRPSKNRNQHLEELIVNIVELTSSLIAKLQAIDKSFIDAINYEYFFQAMCC
jgi:hypothetical protein